MRRATTLMSNMPAVRAILKDRCDGQHRHAALNNGHPMDQLDEHPGALGAAIVRAIKLQTQWDTMGMQLLSVIEPQTLAARAQEDMKVPEGEETPELFDATAEIAWDDVSGKYLDAYKVKQARPSEMEYYRKMSVYRKVPISECIAKTGKKPIGVRWVDIDKGDRTRPNCRSRLVAKVQTAGRTTTSLRPHHHLKHSEQ